MIEAIRNDFPEFATALAAGKGDPIEEILPGVSTSELADLEREIGISLPDSYRRLLQCTRGFWLRGGCIQLSSGHPFFHDFPSLDELTVQQRRVIEAKGGGWPPPSNGMLCFAEFFLEADGDQVLFDVSAGLVNGEYPVVYYAHEDRPPSVRKLANSFPEFVADCLTYPGWS